MISRRLAGLLINFKESAEVLKTRVQGFIVFKAPPPPPRALIEEPERTGCNLGLHKIKRILSLSGQCTDVTINDHSDTHSCQTLQL